ncbi:MAG: GNAT family N-acetyltransferase [Alphaproteobacteria bacterium]|nr:GNAT family N-acetyltransferase [Alphaproteobacteria bacterium]
MSETATPRRLTPADLDAAVRIDAAVGGSPRRGYFEKRLAAALREPEAHIQFGIDGPDGLRAVIFARLLRGEFGRDEEIAVLEVIDVAEEARGAGLGSRLLGALEDEMRKRGIAELQTQASWRQHEMLRFLDHHGFAMAPLQVIDCDVGRAHSL